MNLTSLPEYLKALDTMSKSAGHKASMEGWVLQHGFAMSPAPRNETFNGRIRQCFRNAATFTLSERQPGNFVYCEGFALHIIPTLHAWLLDLRTGLIHDPTWRDQSKCSYYGVPFRRDYLMRSLSKAKVYSLIDQYTLGWPLLRGEHAKHTWIHRKAERLLTTNNERAEAI